LQIGNDDRPNKLGLELRRPRFLVGGQARGHSATSWTLILNRNSYSEAGRPGSRLPLP
jgi:hypothetical protein